MKVTFDKEYKRVFSIEEYEIGKRIIKSMKEYDDTPKWCAECILPLIDCDEVIHAEAFIAKNCRVYDQYLVDGNSEYMDIWIKGIARSWDKYVEFGVYLTDIWSLSDDTRESVKAEMYTRFYLAERS